MVQCEVNERAAKDCEFYGHSYVGQSNCVYCNTPQQQPTVADCARCGNPTSDTDLMDFGPFLNQLICGDCWAAECDAAIRLADHIDGL